MIFQFKLRITRASAHILVDLGPYCVSATLWYLSKVLVLEGFHHHLWLQKKAILTQEGPNNPLKGKKG